MLLFISGSEIFLIVFFIIIFFGAEKIPSIARNAGKMIREVRSASDQIKREIKEGSDQLNDDLNVDK